MHTVREAIKAIGHGIGDILFPRPCPICGHLMEKEEYLCRQCMQSLPRTEQSYLRGNNTEALFEDIPHFERGAAFLFFEKGSDVQRLSHAIKYNRYADPHLAYMIAKEAAGDFMQSDFFDGIDVIIPIPLHPKREKERGFNQSLWIAKGISEITGIRVDDKHIRRIKDNPQQAQMKGKEREQNVEGIFEVTHPEDMYHKHILIVDDVITTGSTIRSCMAAMKAFRGSKTSVFALGKAV